MYEAPFIDRPLRPGPFVTGLGVVAGITAIGIAAALCYEQYRKRELTRSIASTPGAEDILPALHSNAEMLLAALGRPIRPGRQASDDTP
jgi:hypothetical protein